MTTEPDIDEAVVVKLHQRDLAVVAVVFLLLFAFSYSEDIVSIVLELGGHGESTAGWLALVAFDVVVLAAVGVLKRVIAGGDGDPPRLWRWWWSALAAVVALDVFLIFAPEEHPVWIDLASSVGFAVLVGILMMVSLNGDPLTLVSRTRRVDASRDWARVRPAVPLIVGAFASYMAATGFDDFFDLTTMRTLDPELAAEVGAMPIGEQLGALATLCEGAVNPDVFQRVVEVTPLLLLTLGVEFNFFRRALDEPAQRAAAAATVALMCLGLCLSISTLPWAATGCGNVLGYWHEYLTFVVSVQGIATGLATVMWLLVAGGPERSPHAEVVDG